MTTRRRPVSPPTQKEKQMVRAPRQSTKKWIRTSPPPRMAGEGERKREKRATTGERRDGFRRLNCVSVREQTSAEHDKRIAHTNLCVYALSRGRVGRERMGGGRNRVPPSDFQR